MTRSTMPEAAAEAELRWYFGTGPSSAAGDMGLRSPLGAQLEIAKASKIASGVGRAAGGTLGASRGYAVDFKAAEDRVLDGLGAARRVRAVEHRLRQLNDLERRVLRLEFGGPRMVHELSPVVVLTSAAQTAWGRRVAKMLAAWVEQIVRDGARIDGTEVAKAKATAERWAHNEQRIAEGLRDAEVRTKAKAQAKALIAAALSRYLGAAPMPTPEQEGHARKTNRWGGRVGRPVFLNDRRTLL